MHDNIQEYCRASGVPCRIAARPHPDDLIAQSRTMPGNLARLTEFLHSSERGLLITLGSEPAAFLREYARAQDAQHHLYGQATPLQALGAEILVVHLAHPGLLMKNADWAHRHELWCAQTGSALANQALEGGAAGPNAHAHG